MVYISKGNLRMNIPTFSLPAEVTCLNATKLCKKYCYAKKAERQWKHTKKSRIRNYKESKDILSFAVSVTKWLYKHKPEYFRIHESGDFYSQDYLDIWNGIARLFPEIKFLVYTQMYNLNYFLKPDNLTLYWTIWSDSKKIPSKGLKAYVIDNGKNKLPTYKIPSSVIHCKKGKGTKLTCDKCLYCFEGKGDVVFEIH